MSDTLPDRPAPAPVDAAPRPQRRLSLGVILGIEREELPASRSSWAATGSSLALATLLLACSPEADSSGPTAVSTRANAGNVGYYTLIVDSLIDLGMPKGGQGSEAHGVNASGEVAGTTSYGTASRATLWDRKQPAQDLGAGGVLRRAINSDAVGISDAGEVVGNELIYLVNGMTVAGFRWNKSQGKFPLGMLQVWVANAGAYWQMSPTSAAGGLIMDISGNGRITGRAMTTGGEVIPFLYTPGASKPYTASLPSGCGPYIYGQGNGVSNTGIVVGLLGCSSPSDKPVRFWPANSPSPSGSFPSLQEATAVNDAGSFTAIDTAGRAMRWNGTSSMVLLAPTDSTPVRVNGINNHNIVVGYRYNSGSGAFIHGGGLGVTVLPSIRGNQCPQGTFFDHANDINDSNVIVGMSRGCDGTAHAVMWKVRIVFVPTPGPSPSP